MGAMRASTFAGKESLSRIVAACIVNSPLCIRLFRYSAI
jgi:hypothetical protein